MFVRAFLLLCLAALLAPAGEPLWRQDFEDRTPGREPGGWGGKWGQQEDDLLIVSNLRAVSGKQALLLDRTGDSTAMWGVTTGFPDLREGWLRLSFAFLVQGAGHDARFGFEIREGVPAQRRVAGLSFGGSAVKVTPMSESGGHQTAQSVRLGAFEKDAWYRLDLWLPASGNPDRRGAAQLSRYLGDGNWEAAHPPRALPVVAPPEGRGYGQLMFVATPGARGYRLFLDDLQLNAVAAPPETE